MNFNSNTFGCSPMDIQIFEQNLSVTATSAYIVITSLMGDGLSPDMSAIQARWNASAEELEQSLAELISFNIIERHQSSNGSGPIYIANPASLWGPAAI